MEKINGFEYVDLGLPSGLKWANCNLGAKSPEKYGNYYSWGEIDKKSSYKDDNSVTQGVPAESIGNISANPQYDAARVAMGATWRIPTRAEFEELINNCKWEWTELEGHTGNKVTGPNGNSIFFPAAFARSGTTKKNSWMGVRGNYWSSEALGAKDAYILDTMKLGGSIRMAERFYGRTIRPVSE